MSRYPTEQFCEPPKDAFICSICQDVFDEPTETFCRHVFCWECIVSVIDRDPKCPLCRARLLLDELKPVLPVFKAMLSQLEMWCKHDGCPKKLSQEMYLNHIENCDHKEVICPIKNCNMLCFKKDLNEHKSKCEYREIECPKGCGEKMIYKYAADHIDFKCLNGNKKCSTCKKPEYLADDSHNCTDYLLSVNTKITQENHHLDQELHRLRLEYTMQFVIKQHLQQEIQQLRQENKSQKMELDMFKQSSINLNVNNLISQQQQQQQGGNYALRNSPLLSQNQGRVIYQVTPTVTGIPSYGHGYRPLSYSQYNVLPPALTLRCAPQNNGNSHEPMCIVPIPGSAAPSLTEAPQQEVVGTELAEKLYSIIQGLYPNTAGKITGMLIELPKSEVLRMLEDAGFLTQKVEEASKVLKEYLEKKRPEDQVASG